MKGDTFQRIDFNKFKDKVLWSKVTSGSWYQNRTS